MGLRKLLRGRPAELMPDTRKGERYARDLTYNATSASARIVSVLVEPNQITNPIGM